ncbi:hypothetical protein [Phycicoccus sp. CSK15P-2]|uniref:hypothetical protein n=1 Tax=Phycicoccus sp. CSK15P-2 TaxID=2807627 RepID=UPI001EF23BF6|nr:hypothetical protein [Phycicoccus sp. CSK15P-2]
MSTVLDRLVTDARNRPGSMHTLNTMLMSGKVPTPVLVVSAASAPLIIGGGLTFGIGLIRDSGSSALAGLLLAAVPLLMLAMVVVRGLTERVTGVVYALALGGGMVTLAFDAPDATITTFARALALVAGPALLAAMVFHPSANLPGAIVHRHWPMVHVGESLTHALMALSLVAVIATAPLTATMIWAGAAFSLGLLAAGIFCWGEAFHFPLLAATMDVSHGPEHR